MKNNSKHSLMIYIFVVLLSFGLASCGKNTADSSNSNSSSTNTSTSVVNTNNISSQANQKTKQQSAPLINNATVQMLANKNYQAGQSAVIPVNNNHSNLSMSMWHTNCVKYSILDQLNRTSSPAIAFLENRNVANDSLRVRQTVKPTGWHQKFDSQHEAILNRGHIIAYSLSKGITDNGNYDPSQPSGDQNNPRNLFTQTAFCNQELQTIYESKVRNALRQGAKVVYQVQPIFQGNDLMAKGVWLQAVGSNGLNFSVYCFNVQPNYQFNYANGTSVIDSNMQVPTPPNAPHFNNNDQTNNKYTNSYKHYSYGDNFYKKHYYKYHHKYDDDNY